MKACELSGGNKRKLSVAIAMIGNPRVVFLDVRKYLMFLPLFVDQDYF